MNGGAITDVAGVRVGHFTDTRRPTGCSVVLSEAGAVGGVDVRGASPGTRETDLLSPLNSVECVHAVLLAGGSAFGLDAAGGVMRWLEERGIGVEVGAMTAALTSAPPVRVPIVPAAILFDLWVGDASIRPDAQSGYAACNDAADTPPAQGSVGAGTGATVGKLFGIARAMKGGIGNASVKVSGITVGALVAVNAIGDVIDPANGLPLAGARGDDGRPFGITRALLAGRVPDRSTSGTSTTIGVIATDAVLTKSQANKLAQMAHDGLARVIDPVHTPMDGDTLFVLATGTSGCGGDLTVLGAMAARVAADAVLNAVRHASGLPGLPAVADLR